MLPLLGLVVAFLGGGCGSDDQGGGPTAGSVAPTSAPSAAEATLSGPIDGSVPLTRAGAKLRYGQPGVILYQTAPPKKETIRVEIEVLEVERGSLADFKGFKLDRNVRGNTPYYVRARLGNRGPRPITSFGIGNSLKLLDRSGDPAASIFSSLGTFPPRCRPGDPKVPWPPGQAFVDCRIFLVRDGTVPAAVTFPSRGGYLTGSGGVLTWRPAG